MTQIVPLQYIGAPDAVTLLRPFVAAQGAITAHRETNLLILTDTAANIRRLLDILKLVDVEVALDELQIIPIKHADAQELAQILSQLFASGRVRRGRGARSPPWPPAPAAAAPAPAAARPPARPAPSASPLIVAERRSNSLVDPRAQAGHGDHPSARRQARRRHLRRPAGLHLLRREHQGQGPRGHARRHLRARRPRPAITGTRNRRLASIPGSPAYASRPRSPSPSRSGPRRRSAGAPPGADRPRSRASREGGPPAADIRFIADEVTNAIIVTTYPRLWKEIEETIKKLDRMPRQVLIEVLAAEVMLTDDTKLGIEWAVRSGKFTFTNTQNTIGPSECSRHSRPRPGADPLGGALVPVGFNVFAFAANEFIAALNALATENRVNVLSSPSIMTSENKKAVINVSTSVPIVTSQQVPVAAGGNTRQLHHADGRVQGRRHHPHRHPAHRRARHGRPRRQAGGQRRRPERAPADQLAALQEARGGDLRRPAEQPDAGPGRPHPEQADQIRTGIPFLSRIPVLGYLFGSTEEKIEKTELLLLITPRVVGTALDAARITEQMRKGTPELEDAIRQAPRPLPAK